MSNYINKPWSYFIKIQTLTFEQIYKIMHTNFKKYSIRKVKDDNVETLASTEKYMKSTKTRYWSSIKRERSYNLEHPRKWNEKSLTSLKSYRHYKDID